MMKKLVILTALTTTMALPLSNAMADSQSDETSAVETHEYSAQMEVADNQSDEMDLEAGDIHDSALMLELSQDNKDKIRQLLEDQGYSVRKIKIEDGLFEAYAKKDGKKFEVFLNTDLEIVRIKNS